MTKKGIKLYSKLFACKRGEFDRNYPSQRIKLTVFLSAESLTRVFGVEELIQRQSISFSRPCNNKSIRLKVI